MNDAVAPAAWLDANQRHLCAELARIKALLPGCTQAADRDALLRKAAREIEAARDVLPVEAPVDLVAAVFGLTPFERDVLLLAAGVEMDAGIEEACAAAARTGFGHATFSLALAILPEAHWSALLPERPLRRWRLIELDGGAPLALASLRIDERILHFLAGINTLDARLRPMVRALGAPTLVAPAHRETAARIVADLDKCDRPPIVQLHGDDPEGQEDVAALVAAELGWTLHAVRAAELPAGSAERAALATLWTREAALLESALLIDASQGAPQAAIAELAEAVDGPVFVAAREPVALRRDARRFPVSLPARAVQRELWRAAVGPEAGACAGALDMLASQVRLGARAIARLAPEVRAGRDVRAVLRGAAGLASRGALEELATRIEPQATWNDLVTPAPTRALLEELAAHARHRGTVHDEWGFAARASRGLGVTALFVGESGTGKTLAAEVLANELGLDLYRIDLATVVSKYIGETEKNLRRVFDAAEDSGAILLFDEADALFGKRSEVKDSHDRYANVEVSYLLQRMEAYRGLAILTTNMKATLDRAFLRRLRFVVQFPFPDAAQRAAIWRRMFPAAAPTAALDYDRLARLGLAGGTIANIALRAAFRAARSREPIAMTHVVAAARDEYAKLERTLNEAELRGWL